MALKAPKVSGFTLIELLAAIIVFSLIYGVIVSHIAQSRRVDEKLQARHRIIQSMQIAMNRIVNDIRQSYVSLTRGPHYFFKGEDDGDIDRINFTTMAHISVGYNRRESNRAEVGYYVEKRKETQVLMRRMSPFIDDFQDEGGEAYTLLPDVVIFNLEYFDGEEYQKQWDHKESRLGRGHSSAKASELPFAVRITLAAGDKENPKVLMTEFSIPMSNYFTSPGGSTPSTSGEPNSSGTPGTGTGTGAGTGPGSSTTGTGGGGTSP